jgi:hypothetical protein
MHKEKMRYIVILILVFFKLIAFGQVSIHVIDSLILKNNVKGVGNYYLVLDTLQKRHIYDGSFQFEKFFKTNEGDSIAYLTYSGNYNRDQKEGDWTFNYRKLIPTGDGPKINGFQLVQNGSGEDFEVNASFLNNQAHGSWMSSRNSIFDSKKKDSIFMCRANLYENMMQGPFSSWQKDLSVSGWINEEGFIDSLWQFTHLLKTGERLLELRQYNRGVMVNHYFEFKGNKFKMQHIGFDTNIESLDSWTDLAATNLYFDVVKYTSLNSDTQIAEKPIELWIDASNNFLKNAIFSFGIHDDVEIWKVTHAIPRIKYPRFRLKEFPFTNDEVKNIQSALAHLSDAQKIIKQYLEDPQVEISKFKHKEIARFNAALPIMSNHIEGLQKVFTLLNSPSMLYINHKDILSYLLQDIEAFPLQISFDYEGDKTTEIFKFPPNLAKNNLLLNDLFSHVDSLYEMVNNVKSIFNPILERKRKMTRILEYENQLLGLKDTILSLFSNNEKRRDYNGLHLKNKEAVITFVSNEFENYAKKEIEERILEIDQLKSCFEKFLVLFQDFVRIQNNINKVKEEYTRVVWNPFTLTDMTETVKERVFNAYENHLIKHLHNSIHSLIACNKVQLIRINFDKLTEKMMDLRKQDTKELEKNLKRLSDLNQIIKLFDLQFL